MIDDLEQEYSTTTAALLAGAAPKVVRNWIDRKQLFFLTDVDGRREGAEWRRFSVWNVIQLAVTRRIADLGVPVNVASHVAMGIFRTIDISDFSAGRISRNQFIKRLPTIFLWRKGDLWDFDYGHDRAHRTAAVTAYIITETGMITREVFDNLDAEAD